jgi:hypothetical protein
MGQNTKQLIRELIDEVLEEMTSTGGGMANMGYMTPNAFRGHKSKKKTAERSMPGGMVVGDEYEGDDTTIGEVAVDGARLPTIRRGMSEGRSRYRNFKESDMMKTHSKISYGINQSKKMLQEVEYLLGICERLKTECDVPTNNLWARTRPDMKEIHQRLKEIARRINRMGK